MDIIILLHVYNVINFSLYIYCLISAEWRYVDSSMDGPNIPDGGQSPPKLEDFLGCYSGSSPTNDHRVYSQPPNEHAGEINVNIPPNYCTTTMSVNREENLNSPYPLACCFSQDILPNVPIHNPSHDDSGGGGGLYHIPFDGATTISGFKSWLRQPPPSTALLEDDKSSGHVESNANFQALSLGMSPTTAQPPLQSVDTKKQSSTASISASAKPMPRKSVDTFGQRTSQFRGVTRYTAIYPRQHFS